MCVCMCVVTYAYNSLGKKTDRKWIKYLNKYFTREENQNNSSSLMIREMRIKTSMK